MKSYFTLKLRGRMVQVRVLEMADLTSKEGSTFYSRGQFLESSTSNESFGIIKGHCPENAITE